MSFGFFQAFGGTRLDGYTPPDPMDDSDEEADPATELNYEMAADEWGPRTPALSDSWEPGQWDGRPRRFVDGKDVGETVAWLRAPGGYPAPVRLSQIGSVVAKVRGRRIQRVFHTAERVVSVVTDPFPWSSVEAFASELQDEGFRLLPARPPKVGGRTRCTFDFEKMRKAAQNRSNTEMVVLEEVALSQDTVTPTVVDGRLAPRSRGFDHEDAPVLGVIKTHRKRYLHDEGMRTLYALNRGQRTPMFAIGQRNIDVVSWYLRLSGEADATPNYGLIRVEAPRAWFEAQGHGPRFADRLTRFLVWYRHRGAQYDRAAISLHPIVRAEELLGACFCDSNRLNSRFCRSAGV